LADTIISVNDIALRVKDNGDGTYSALNIVKIIGNLIASGKKTDADGTDRTIDTTSLGGFNRIVLDCSDCTAEMTFTVDEAISSATKPIYVKNGLGWSDNISGDVLHYTGSGTFRYQLIQ